ncbi:extracellular solute-binding protein [Pseudovibrio sp. Tun.PSC04-5.I4]|uniref:extracellular solute-binding protein n=1 Tax=Pseudovibrio sp. Tun.PSC04-5.I4 TaxID=1798213 RepID=UPI0008884ACA|nr:extracellular solute-binding protein [Pseudovibrio sp. Tun.PSC04-5.I4]SDR24569.1 microcin C transport system substrate-binding protein [Pseudovibrio sp. Tun.PSC04-5.I4]
MRTKLYGPLTGLALAVASLASPSAIAETNEPEWRYADSLISAPQMPRDFKHFPYVNPDAPKGGTVRLSWTGTFDSLNPVASKGVTAIGLGLVYDTLMTPSMSESSTEYGLIADALKYPDDFSWVTYRLRPEARWHDGKQITAEDVGWSFDQWTKLAPREKYYYRHVTGYEILSPTEIRFNFAEPGNREAPQILGSLMILPKHWWTASDKDGDPRDISRSTLEAPLSSGAYRVGKVVAGRSISYDRVEDYWAKDLNVNVGSNNFDKIAYDYYRDETVQLEAFKADSFDWRTETTAKNWATAYDIPQVENQQIILEKFPQTYRGSGLMLGFILNTRKEMFQDRRVRKALNYALNFEEMNRTIFFGQYSRFTSYFDGTKLASSGLPEGRELEILKSLKAPVPEEIFTEPYENPASEDSRQERSNLREALGLLKEAGYVQKQGKLVNEETGKPLTIEYLMNGGRFERVALRYQASLRKIGIDLQLRVVDSSQFVNRVRSRDFDMMYTGWAQSLSPGNEQRGYWGSESADNEASQNYAGVKDPVIDELINIIINSDDREELIAATKAMDRILMWEQYVVPSWTSPFSRIARWDRFSHAKQLPEFAIGFPTVWWWDEAKAQKVREAN